MAVFLLAGPLACGAAPSAPTTPVAATAVPIEAAAPAVVSAAALTPAPEPADVVGIFRWKNPLATLTTAGASVPAAFAETAGREAAKALFEESLSADVDTNKLAALVALDAPIDGMITLNPNVKKRNVLAAFSIGLTSLEAAKQTVRDGLVETMPSVWRVSKNTPCVIAASAGAAPARLVCGSHERDLPELVPYMTRTLPTAAPPAADFHGELRVAPVDARYGDMLRQLLSQAPILARSELSIGEPLFDRAITEAASGLSEELRHVTGDLDKLVIDVTAAADGVSAKGAISLRKQQSWFANALVGRADRAGAPPPIFWRVPKDADYAVYSRGADPSDYVAIERVFQTLAEGALMKAQVGSAADRKAIAALLKPPFSKDAASVTAGGRSLQPTRPRNKPVTEQQAIEAILRSSLGWTLIGVEERPSAVAKYITDAVTVYNRPGVTTSLKKAVGSDAKGLPTVKTTAAPASLGAGAVAVEVKFSNLSSLKGPAGKNAKSPVIVTAYVLVMADQNRSWIAMGMDKDELIKHLLDAKTGAAEAGTLAQRSGLDSLRNAKQMTGGFVTIAPIVKSLRSSYDELSTVKTTPAPAELTELVTALSVLPNRGETPILLGTTASASEAAMSITVPQPAIDDLMTASVTIMKILAK
jgi:hypothetical protein